MLILIYDPKRMPIPRRGNLDLDYYEDGKSYRVRLKPGQNKVAPDIWEKIKSRTDVADLISQDKAIQEVSPASPEDKQVLDRAGRQENLEALNWRELRDIALSLGIEEKPEEGWEAAVPFILAAEGY